MSVHVRRGLIAAIIALLPGLGARPTFAIEVGGGGSPKIDCLTTFVADANHPVSKPRSIRCADGDPTCDLDGIVNGVCHFQVGVCANSTFNAGSCDLQGVDFITVLYSVDNGDPKFDPQFQALATRINSDIAPYPNDDPDSCTTPTNFFVPIKGPFKNDKCKKNKKTIRIVTESTFAAGQGKVLIDKDKFDMTCEPPVGGCDPGVIFASTYDRVQRQIFDQSCAVSGCHDSNAFMNSGDLLLEASAFPGNLVDRTPTNADADALGWKRIVPGDVDASYILHKVNGDFPGPGFGDRMPLGRPKLDQTLIDVLTLWIEAGAPDSGWVPGTD